MSLRRPDKRSILAELYQLAQYIEDHEFWKAQVQQIYVNNNYDFELIPRVGSHVIVFGDISNCEEKFNNLESLYINGLNAVGWNKYETINLKYKGQVICTKR
jgi:cell division protein FtsQ